jgi:Uma2 family endonuclease
MSLSVSDVEKVQELFSECQVELREGKIIVTSPSDLMSSEIGVMFMVLLGSWVHQHDWGHILSARTGICLPNGDLLSPKVAFVSRERLKRVSRTYLFVAPDLVVEIKSIWDRIRELEGKIALFLNQGVQVGLLIDPDKHTVRVYRSSSLSKDAEGEEVVSPVAILRDGDTLTIPELFPGWEMAITDLWPPVYE